MTPHPTNPEEVPNPGSKKAREKGCRCPVIDNHYGKGRPGYLGKDKPDFWISGDCPIHGLKVIK